MAADSGTYTDATLATRRRLAEAMMKQGTDASPISSHWQGLARLTNSLMGGYGLHKLGQEEKEANEKATASLMNLPGLGGSVSPAPGSPAPMVTSPSGPSDRVEVAPKMWVDKAYKDRFGALLTELEAEGYKVDPSQSGGYNKRNIAGTNTPSKHSFGHAIDVNWRDNAEGKMGAMARLLGDDKVREIAARHGLTWGGNFKSRSRDDMHFEVDPKWQPPGAESGMPLPLPPQGMPTAPQGAPAAQPMPPSAPVQVAQAPGGTMTDAAPDAAQIKALIANPRTRAVGLQMYQQWRQQQTKQDAPTDVMRNYRMDVAQRVQRGEKDIPTLGEWMTAQKRAGATNVTMNQGYEKEFDKKLAAQEAERYDKLVKGGSSARDQIASLDMIGEALNVYNSGAKFGTGTLGPAEQTVRQWAVALGVADEKTAKSVGAAELAAAVQNRMALQMRSPDGGMGMPGALSDADRKFLVASQPGIDKTPQGNARMIENFKKLAQRQVQVGEMVADWVAEKGSMKGFEKHLNAWANANPLFPPADTSAGGWSIKRVQ